MSSSPNCRRVGVTLAGRNIKRKGEIERSLLCVSEREKERRWRRETQRGGDREERGSDGGERGRERAREGEINKERGRKGGWEG